MELWVMINWWTTLAVYYGIYSWWNCYGNLSIGVSPQSVAGYNESRVGNKFVTWEKSAKGNVGFDCPYLRIMLCSLLLITSGKKEIIF